MPVPASILAFLDTPYALAPEQIAFFQRCRYIELKAVLNPETLKFFNAAIAERVLQMNTSTMALEGRSTYGKAFLQLFNFWCYDAVVKPLMIRHEPCVVRPLTVITSA